MLVFLMQHGPCLSRELNPAQPLSPVGRDLVSRSARGMRTLGLNFHLLAASPRPQALQTARLVASVLGNRANQDARLAGPLPVVTDNAFLPLADPASGIQFLRSHGEAQRVFIIGHLPGLARLASRLLTSGPAVQLDFNHGSLVCVETELGTGPGRLRMLAPPELLQAAAD